MAPRLLASLLLLTGLGCDAELPDEPGDGPDDSFLAGGKSDSLVELAEARGILRLVNTADLETLDDDVGLDRRAAEHIINHRHGPDARADTADDNPFDSLAELDGVSWVGPRAFAKLRAYAIANGYVPRSERCLVISEYIEGWGQYNKAIELFNCGGKTVELDRFSVCLVRDGDTDCSLASDLGSATLAPGAVTTVCRRKAYHPAALDPIPALAEACDLERAGVMTFNGDDRLLILYEDGSVADSLGRVGYRPPQATWADIVLHRCDLTPADGVSFYDHRDYFTSATRSRVSGFGVAPIAGCP